MRHFNILCYNELEDQNIKEIFTKTMSSHIAQFSS